MSTAPVSGRALVAVRSSRGYTAQLGALAAVLLIACAPAHPENPALDAFPPGVSGSTAVTYYDIHGRTAAELVAEMRQLGPKASGASFFGETQSPVSWTWQSRRSGDNCQLTAVRVIVHSEITLPRWVPPADTVPGLVAQWRTFLVGLETHEIGHKDIAGREALGILRRLQSINTYCSSVNDEIRRATDGIVSAARQEQVTYDADTRHGATQGAVFVVRSSRPVATDPISGCYELIEGAWATDSTLNRFYPARRVPRTLRLDTALLPGWPSLQALGEPMMMVRTGSKEESVPPFVYWRRLAPHSDRIEVSAPLPYGGASLNLRSTRDGLGGHITTFTDAIPPDGVSEARAPISLRRVACP